MRAFIRLARLAYSAERAAAFAYRGHAASVRDPQEKADLRRIEDEEWLHRENLARILAKLGERPSPWLEAKYWCIGKAIGLSCHVIGRFMPMYFAGRLESGNVMEYVHMEILARGHGMEEEIGCIREMARVEKSHEDFFLGKAQGHGAMGVFEKVFGWGRGRSFNALAPEPFELFQPFEPYGPLEPPTKKKAAA
jgi:demethoxyubiquinone hydroxylase (CLK1/Coq7/Cat5 family)